MNNINFIEPVPSSISREVHIWSLITTLLISGVIINIGIYSGIKWRSLHTARQERHAVQQQINGYNAILEKQQRETKQKEQLEQNIHTLTRYKTKPKNPIAFLNALYAITGNGLQSITISKKQFELNVACQQAQHAALCLQKLQQESHIRMAQLITLQMNKKQIIAHFKGERAP